MPIYYRKRKVQIRTDKQKLDYILMLLKEVKTNCLIYSMFRMPERCLRYVPFCPIKKDFRLERRNKKDVKY